ncbi:site-specific integrase [Rummeliibacillus stabekisii]|uniref:tyrosine-type recombinase/integrase n=1 Tax=Rummeliibacillus stabekisii TaxID=241244 RepID=UPI00203CC460|nr:site-specific integrase [Rummeliibacillus stabekisii]MCM3317329.1 site-specific integrase [Rummeliibacillus stabekisii]
MASFQKRKDKWQYTVSRVINGKSKPIRKSGFLTKKEAMVAAAEVEASLAKGILPILKKIPFAHYFKKWIELYKEPKVSNTTLKHYQYSLKAVEDYFFDTPIQNIKKMDYQKFLNNFGSNKAKETVAKVNGHIKSCIKDAIDDQIIQIDFTRNAQVTWTVQAKKPIEKHLNYEESKQLLNSIYNKLNDNSGLGYYLLLLGLTSGLRFGELVGLTRNDFDFAKNTIRVNKTWGYKSSAPTGFGATKNEQSMRVIKMDGLTMDYFKKLFISLPTNIHQLVFFSPSSKYKVISNTNANKLLKKLLDELNIESITVHGLRHTHASVLLYKKASIHYVSERLGHSDIETTLKQYTHVLTELRIQDEKITVDTFENMAGVNIDFIA